MSVEHAPEGVRVAEDDPLQDTGERAESLSVAMGPDEDDLLTESLIEEISIDGMCGVY